MSRAAGLWVALPAFLLAACAEQYHRPIDSPLPPASAPVPAAVPAATPVPAAGADTALPPVRGTARRGRRKGDDRPDFHEVARGDTLFHIALDYGFDYRDLAAWNGLSDPSRIRVGQRLRLQPPPPAPQESVVVELNALPERSAAGPDPVPPEPLEPPAPAVETAVPILTEPRALTLPWSEQTVAGLARSPSAPPPAERRPAAPGPAVRPAPVAASPGATVQARVPPVPATPAGVAPAPAPGRGEARPAPEPRVLPESRASADTRPVTETESDEEEVAWLWPVRGDLLYRFGAGGMKGIGIAGKAGSPVLAAAGGRVVYAGNGMRGYGNMVIVKHNDSYLTVYAHNSALLVRERDSVQSGQKIAEMGDSDADRVALHFELRRFGKPVDPLPVLPRR